MMNRARTWIAGALLLVLAGAMAWTQAKPDQVPQKEAPPKAPAATSVEEPSGVVYFNQEQVSESFAKSGAIYKFTPGHNYQVSAVTRSGPGQAEIHTTDTDIIYMLSGTATMVTGGTIVEARNQSPTEIRGVKITGGVTREVRKGELIIIPKGTPHWTTSTDGTVQLLVVKVQ